MSCGCGTAHDPEKDESLKNIPSPEPPPIAPRIAEMSEVDREVLREKLQSGGSS